MDMRFFFDGDKEPELSSSAFLALLLDGSAEFRQEFLRRALRGAGRVDDSDLHVAVEVGDIDVTMSLPGLEVIIENKIQTGSVLLRQLAGYYERVRPLLPAERRVAAVMVAPLGVGAREVDRLTAVLRPGDVAAHLSWDEDIDRCVRAVPAGVVGDIARTGHDAVMRVVGDRRAGLAETQERLAVRQIAQRATEDLDAARPGVLPRRWEGRGAEWIMTRRSSPFRLELSLEFPTGGPPGYDPQTDLVDGIRTVQLKSVLAMGSLVKAGSELGRRWASVGIEFEVPGVGTHARSEPRQPFARTEQVRGTAEHIAERLAAIGVAAIDELRAFGDGAEGGA